MTMPHSEFSSAQIWRSKWRVALKSWSIDRHQRVVRSNFWIFDTNFSDVFFTSSTKIFPRSSTGKLCWRSSEKSYRENSIISFGNSNLKSSDNFFFPNTLASFPHFVFFRSSSKRIFGKSSSNYLSCSSDLSPKVHSGLFQNECYVMAMYLSTLVLVVFSSSSLYFLTDFSFIHWSFFSENLLGFPLWFPMLNIILYEMSIIVVLSRNPIGVSSRITPGFLHKLFHTSFTDNYIFLSEFFLKILQGFSGYSF